MGKISIIGGNVFLFEEGHTDLLWRQAEIFEFSSILVSYHRNLNTM